MTPDMEKLREILQPCNEHELSGEETKIFSVMLANVMDGKKLSSKQRAWVNDVWKRIKTIHADEVPMGDYVPTPSVLLNLPKKPPGRGL